MKTKLIILAACAAFASIASFAQPAATPADAASLHKLSIERLQQKNSKEAVELAEKASQLDPANPEYFSQLGIALSRRMSEVNFMQMAVLSSKLKKAFEKSVALDPNHISGLIGLSQFYSNAPEIAGGSLTKAREFAARIHAINPLQGEMEFGRIAEKDENYAEAFARYDAALKLKPDSSGLQFASGRMLVKLGKKDEARARFEATLALKPDHDGAKQALAALDAPTAK